MDVEETRLAVFTTGSEVNDLDRLEGVISKQKIFRLEIAVNHALVLHVEQALHQLLADAFEVIRFERARPEVLFFQEVVEVLVQELKDNDDVLSEFEVVLYHHYFVMPQNVLAWL